MSNTNFLSVLCPFSCLYLQMSELAPRRLAVERPNNGSLDDVIAASNPKCRFCLEHHPLRKCPKFRRLSSFKRLSVVKRLKYCINCLAHSHFFKECQSRERYMECLQEHHSILHIYRRGDSNEERMKNASAAKKSHRGKSKY